MNILNNLRNAYHRIQKKISGRNRQCFEKYKDQTRLMFARRSDMQGNYSDDGVSYDGNIVLIAGAVCEDQS